MSDKISLNKRPGKSTKQMIALCPRCKGKPITKEFINHEFTGTMCAESDCLLAVTWQKIIDPPVIKKAIT